MYFLIVIGLPVLIWALNIFVIEDYTPVGELFDILSGLMIIWLIVGLFIGIFWTVEEYEFPLQYSVYERTTDHVRLLIHDEENKADNIYYEDFLLYKQVNSINENKQLIRVVKKNQYGGLIFRQFKFSPTETNKLSE